MIKPVHPSDSLLSVYRTAFAHSMQGFCLLEKVPTLTTELSDFRYLLTNAAFEQHVGLHQAVGKTIRQLVPQAETQIMAYYDGVALTGEPIYFEDYVATLDLWIAVDAFRVGEFERPTIGVLVTNITQRKQAEKALRKSEENYRLLGIASSDSIYKMSPDWTQMYQLIGKTFLADTHELNYSWLQVYIPADDQPRVQQVIQEAIHTKSTFELEHRVRRADGTLGWTFSRAIPVLDEQGTILEWLGAASDITARKQAEEDLRQSEEKYRHLSAALDQQVRQRTEQLEVSIQELHRSNANLQEFAYVASHDLQEPLRKIQQFGELLKTHSVDPTGDDQLYLERMQTAAQRMSILIRDLLDYSRLTTQRDLRQPVSLQEVVDRVLTTLDLVITETGTSVQVAPLPTILGDPTQLGQLFQNLLSNAVKFRPKTIIPVIQITVQTIEHAQLPPTVTPVELTPTYYQIDVADNGIGFEEKYLDRIFQVFQRLHGKGEYVGTGIGLAICKKVVTNHGGAITGHSQPGQGARFSVYFPI